MRWSVIIFGVDWRESMVNRQRIYVSLAISVSVCTVIGAYLLYRHRRKIIGKGRIIRESSFSWDFCSYFQPLVPSHRWICISCYHHHRKNVIISNDVRLPNWIMMNPNHSSRRVGRFHRSFVRLEIDILCFRWYQNSTRKCSSNTRSSFYSHQFSLWK